MRPEEIRPERRDRRPTTRDNLRGRRLLSRSSSHRLNSCSMSIGIALLAAAVSHGGNNIRHQLQDDWPLNMVIITDWHTNFEYNRSLGHTCQCTHWPGHALRPGCELSIPASEYGQYGCDSSLSLAQSSLRAAAEAMPEPDAVLILGDLVTHHSPSSQFTQSTFHTMSEQIHEHFPRRPFACQTPLGNNDAFPNYGINNSDATFYAEQAEAARRFCGMTDAEAAVFIAKGYYSRQLRPRDRLLVLNTNLYAHVNPAMSAADAATLHGRESDAARDPDPLGQFAWMRSHFEWAKANGGRIYITGHIPPALDSYVRFPLWHPAYAARYWALVSAYPTLLGFHLFAHLHSAEVRALHSHDPAVQAAPALQILTSVSPIYKSNPSFYTLRAVPSTRESNLTLHSFDLGGLLPGAAPVYKAMPPRPLDARRGLVVSNAQYLELFDTFLQPALNASAAAQFKAFFDQYKGGHHGLRLACEDLDAKFQDCLSCDRDCRVGFVCLQAHGTSLISYEACVLAHRRKN